MPENPEKEQVIETEPAENPDQAVGELINPFSNTISENEGDQNLAVEGEKRLHFGLMISMVVVWSAIGAVVGLVLPPIIAGFGLLTMAVFGLWLGEKWIPVPQMRILGVTWVIISMKLLYGLALDAHHWNWIDESELLIAALVIITLNIIIAQHHDEDAIAAQATLVLLVLGSAVGAHIGELGLAAAILVGAISLHSLALLRHSGNLASLGIAVTNLWIGIHAMSSGWEIFELEIIRLSDPLLLFVLMSAITALNAVMAAAFYQEENWFSTAFAGLGLGRPGLWSVSVGLGMIGVLMALSANSEQTGLALAMLTLLTISFGTSYLVVRGVEWRELAPWVGIPMSLTLALLIMMVNGVIFTIDFLSPYSVYSVLTAFICGSILLRHQSSVSDHVLWLGGVMSILLLTLLIPSDSIDGSRFLLLGIFISMIALSLLAILRKSPSIAGVTMLSPWIWLMVLATDVENRMVGLDVITLQLQENDLAFFIIGIVLVQTPMIHSLGSSMMNISGRLAGLSEIGARARDSGVLRIDSLALICSLLTVLAITRPQGLPMPGLLLIMALIMGSTLVLSWWGEYGLSCKSMLGLWGVSATILSWRFGINGAWSILLFIGSTILLLNSEKDLIKARNEGEHRDESEIGSILMLSMGLLAIQAIIVFLQPPRETILTGTDSWFDSLGDSRLVLLSISSMILLNYLPRASHLDKLLPPAISAVCALGGAILMSYSSRDDIGLVLGILLFLLAGGWLSAQGEFRAGLKAITQKEERIARLEEKKAAQAEFAKSLGAENIEMVDAELLKLAEKQRKSYRRSGAEDLRSSDIHHKPVIVLTFLVASILFCSWLAMFTGQRYTALAIAVLTSLLFIGLARERSQQVGIRLPDLLGIELPIAWSMIGLTLVHLAGNVGIASIDPNQKLDWLVLAFTLCILAGLGLRGRSDLGLRIPSAIEGVVGLLLIDRFVQIVVLGTRFDPVQGMVFTGDVVTELLPRFGVEVILLILVLMFDWVEGERLKRELSDHRGAIGRSIWMMLVLATSWGVASLLALILGGMRAKSWQQPAVVMVAWCTVPLAHFSSGLPGASWTGLVLGMTSIIWVSIAVRSNAGNWTNVWLWSLHILAPISALLISGISAWLVITLLATSASSWIAGVIELRRSWRIIGASDLAISWVFAAVVMTRGADVMMLLLMLITSAVLLGLITWLGQRNEKEMAIS